MYLNAGTPLWPHLTFLLQILQSSYKSTMSPSRGERTGSAWGCCRATWNTHTDSMHSKHSTAHWNMQIIFSKCCLHLRSYKYCWEESNKARDGRWITEDTSSALTLLQRNTFGKLLNPGTLTVCQNILLILMYIRYTKSCIF